MKIIRDEKYENGACLFYTEDGCKYLFKISGQQAVLHTASNLYIDEVIDEFLFYSGFVTSIKTPEGKILRERNVELEELEIKKIQPSQFFINERKLSDCKKWIKRKEDIMIPVTKIDGKIISLDGHTRLKAALQLGYDSVYVYPDDVGEYIMYFVTEAVNRGICSISDMEIISEQEYELKWHKFCDDFFEKEKQ